MNIADTTAERTEIALACEMTEVMIETGCLGSDLGGLVNYIHEATGRRMWTDLLVTALLATIRLATEIGDEYRKQQLLKIARNLSQYYKNIQTEIVNTIHEST